MKKIIYSILSILFVPTILMLYSYNSGSPGGKTGSTGDGGSTCTQCHAGTANTQSGWITTNIPFTGYTGGETYTITVTGTHSGVVKMGFELTAETLSGTKKGTWIITDAGRTKLANANASVTHTAGGTSLSGNTSTWSANWTAPTSGTGSIKFNTAVNAANGNGTTSGDQIYTSVKTVGEAAVLNPEIVSVNPDSGEQGWVGNIVITGNETSWNDGVGVVIFKYHDNTSITLTPANFTVSSNTVINASFNIPNDQQIGMYDVFVDNISMENGFEVEELELNPQIVSIDPDNGRQDSEGDYLISGSETMWTEGIENVVFKYHDDNNITLEPQSITIDNDTEVTVVLAIPIDQQLGVYDIYVDDIMLENGFTVDILDAISDELISGVNIYPNPAQNYLNLDLPEGSEYRIVAIDGRQMSDFKSANSNNKLNVSNLENGIYFVQVKMNGESFTKKFVKN